MIFEDTVDFLFRVFLFWVWIKGIKECRFSDFEEVLDIALNIGEDTLDRDDGALGVKLDGIFEYSIFDGEVLEGIFFQGGVELDLVGGGFNTLDLMIGEVGVGGGLDEGVILEGF